MSSRALLHETEFVWIESILRSHFLFADLDDDKIREVAEAFEVVEYAPGKVIMKQDQMEDQKFFYIVATGQCQVEKNGKVLPPPYGTLTEGSSFGELSFLFNTTRAATIISDDEDGGVKLYRLDGTVFVQMLGVEKTRDLREAITKIDTVIDAFSGEKTKTSDGSLLRPYNPRTVWLLRQWRGTVIQYTWKKVVAMVIFTACLCLILDITVLPDYSVIEILKDSQHKHPVLVHLELFGMSWNRLATLTTFVLTFFLNQAYTFWWNIYVYARTIQGKLNNISMLLAAAASRSGGVLGELTPGAEKILDDVAHLARLTHSLYWAGVVKRYNILLTPQGLMRMLSRGLMKKEEYEKIVVLRKEGAHFISLGWLTTCIIQGAEDGHIKAENASIQVILSQIAELRGFLALIPLMYVGRMPLAYVHFVEVLVTFFIISAPFALFPLSGYWAVLSVGILTLFYAGVLDLAKMLLDPLDNDGVHRKSFYETPSFDVGVLIRENNASSVSCNKARTMMPKRFSGNKVVGLC